MHDSFHTIRTTHRSDCSPETPCQHCEIVKFLQRELGDKYENLVKMTTQLLQPVDNVSPEVSEKLDEDINFDKLSARVANAIKSAGIENHRELVRLTEEDFMNLDNIGRKSFLDTKEYLMSLGLYFGIKTEV